MVALTYGTTVLSLDRIYRRKKMELIVKVGTVTPDQKNYQDGDIVTAMSDVQIEYCHAEMTCHVD